MSMMNTIDMIELMKDKWIPRGSRRQQGGELHTFTSETSTMNRIRWAPGRDRGAAGGMTANFNDEYK